MQRSTVWRRRVVLMAVIGLAVAIPATIVIAGSGDGDGGAPGAASVDEELPLNPRVGDDELDAEYNVPEGWRLKRRGDVLTLESADRTVKVGISAPGPPDESEQVLDEALASLRATYETVEIVRGSGSRVGGLKAEGAVVRARQDNVDLRIVVAVMSGRERSYLVEVFTAAAAPKRPVAEAQRFLDSLQLKG